MNDAKGKMKSVLRISFERDALPHLEALRRTSLWLTLHGSNADELVLRTVTRGYRSWQASVDSVGIRLRLFRILTKVFFGSENRMRPSGGLLPERYRTSAASDDDGGGACAPLDRKELVLLASIPNMAVKAAIARLNSLPRLIMILSLREKFSYAEIAYITDLHRDSIRSVLGRLHRQIPRYLVDHADSRAAAADCHNTTHEGMISNENISSIG